jgi:hypothetical protein
MAGSNPINKGFKSSSDMSATDYRFVKGSSADFVVEDATAGAQIIGIRQESPDGSSVTQAVNVAIAGTSKLTAGGTITRYAKLKSDANGAGVASSTDTDEYGAIALEDGVSGQVIEVLVVPGQTLSA